MSDLPGTPSSPSPPEGALLPPPRIPDHELLRRIGRGAYGEVWIARGVTGAYRAVKVVRRSSFNHGRPFEREFEGILKFEPISRTHDSQVDILHVGRGDDYFYYVMELADDQTTGGQINPDNYQPRTLKSDLLSHGSLAFEECVSIGIALTTALAHLHRSGLVHRDVKPSNIIFVNGVAKLADIGLVTGLDTTRSYVGTEGFAAPEGPGTPQADLFSLGKVLYEMSTGKDRQEFPELPTNLRELPERDGLLELNAVIAKACRHDPRDRYPNAAAMRAELELLQSGKSLARLRRVEKRLRILRRTGAAATALALLALAAFWFQAKQTKQARNLSEQNRRLAEENRQRVLQLDAANGLREMEAGDLGRAMLWFNDGLKYATNDPAQGAMHRLRLSMLLQMHPEPLAIIPAGGGTNDSIDLKCKISGDGQRMFVSSDNLALWDLSLPPRQLLQIPRPTNHLSYTRTADGRRWLFAIEGAMRLWTVDASNNVRVTSFPAKLRHFEFADDDRLIVGVNSNEVVVALEADSGRMVREFAHFDLQTDRLLVSGNGKRAAVVLTNGMVHVVETDTGKFVSRFHLHPRHQLDFVDASGRFGVSSPAGEWNATIYQAYIWDLNSGSVIGAPLGHDGVIWITRSSRAGRRIATGSEDKTARVWNQITGDAITPPLKHDAAVIRAAFSPDDARLATGDRDGTVRVWEVETGRPVTPPLRHDAGLTDIAFARDGALLVTATADGLIRLWDLVSAEAAATRLATPSDVRQVAFSPNGEFLLVRSRAPDTTLVWRVRDWSLVFRVEQKLYDSSEAHTFSPDSQYLAITERAMPRTRLWKLESGQAVGFPIQHGTNRILAVAFSSDANVLATGGDDQTLRLWDWRQGRQFGDPLEHTGRVVSVRFSPRGDRLLSLSVSDGMAQSSLWDLDRRALIARGTPREEESGVDQLTPVFSPDGSRWLSAPSLYTVQTKAASDDRPLCPLMRHDNTILCMRFDPEGKRVLTGGADQTARIWNAVTGEPLTLPLLHNGYVTHADFGRNTPVVMTATWNEGALRFWDRDTGLPITPILPFRARRQNDNQVALHNDGRILAISTLQQGVVIYDLRGELPGDQLEDTIKWVTGAILAGGRAQQLPRKEVLELQKKMRTRQPERFELSNESLERWHEAQILEFAHLSQVEASLFHCDRLRELQPGQSPPDERRALLAAKRVGLRDSAAPARLIDLTDYYTRSFATQGDERLTQFAYGIHQLAGTDFDLRGIIALDHSEPRRRGAPGECPAVSYIRIAQRCHRLHFLQGTLGGPEAEGAEASRFVIHFAGGSQRTVRMICGRHLRSCTSKLPVTEAVVAWEGSFRLYKTTWENPTPDVEITHLEFQMGEQIPRPFVVAITAE